MQGQTRQNIWHKLRTFSFSFSLFHTLNVVDFSDRRIPNGLTYLETVVWPIDANFCSDWWIAGIIVASIRCWWRQWCHWYWLFHWTSWKGLLISHWSFHVLFYFVLLNVNVIRISIYCYGKRNLVVISYVNSCTLKTTRIDVYAINCVWELEPMWLCYVFVYLCRRGCACWAFVSSVWK